MQDAVAKTAITSAKASPRMDNESLGFVQHANHISAAPAKPSNATGSSRFSCDFCTGRAWAEVVLAIAPELVLARSASGISRRHAWSQFCTADGTSTWQQVRRVSRGTARTCITRRDESRGTAENSCTRTHHQPTGTCASAFSHAHGDHKPRS